MRCAALSTLRQDLGHALWRLADLIQADERRQSFRAKAYRRAVWALDDLTPDLTDPPDVTLSVPGIGAGVLRLIDEFRASGRIESLDRLAALYPEDVAALRRLPRMSTAMLRSLKGDLGVDHAADLLAAIEGEALETLRGVGPATCERWTQILELPPSGSALPAFQAVVVAEALGRHLERHVGGKTWPAGSVRRVDEWVSEIDLVAGVENLDSARSFLEETAVAYPLDHSDPGRVRLALHSGALANVDLADPSEVGLRLLVATGPPEHVDALLSRAGDGAPTEAEVYERNGLTWIPAPARVLPIDVAAGVVQLPGLRGDLHVHTDWSPDGRMSLEAVLADVTERGYEYVMITDHTKGLRFGGMDEEALIRQREEIDQARAQFPSLAVLHGAELNVDRMGSLDIDDAGLDLLDMAVVGLHSHFDLDRREQTARVLAALEHPVVRVLAHPTGRRIGIRPPIELDIDAVIASAIEHQVALEVNGHRDRLDLSAELAARAVAAGALLAANSDGHRIGELGNVANSVATMQRAGVGPASVVNTWQASLFLDWVSSTGRD